MKKKLWLLLSLVFCIVVMTGCGSKKVDNLSTFDKEVMQNMKDNVTYNADQWYQTDFAEFAESGSVSEEDKPKFKMWAQMHENIGEVVEKGEPKVTEGEKDETSKFTIVITYKVNYENRTIVFTGTFTPDGTFKSFEADEIVPKSKIMKKALINTLMGMGTVFVVLILISCIIGLFGLVNKMQNKPAKQETVAPVAVEPPVQETVEEDVTDDLELVAVITAAIMASMGDEVPADGLVVRSIKKRSVKSWKNA